MDERSPRDPKLAVGRQFGEVSISSDPAPSGQENQKLISSRLAFALAVMIAWAFLMFAFVPNAAELIGEYWIIIPVAFLAAAFANATAVGGGFLFVPLFIFGYGLPVISSLKLSIATQAFGMSSGALGWSRKFIIMKALAVGGLASVLGMWVGTYEWILPGLLIKKAFGWTSIFICVALLVEIRYRTLSYSHDLHQPNRLKLVGFVVVSFAGGLITSWTAIGIGEIVALYLLLVYRTRIESAIGTGVAVLALNSIAGFGFHSQLGGIPWVFLAFTAPGVLIGGYTGAYLGRTIEEKVFLSRQRRQTPATGHSPLKWLLAVVILIDGIGMLLHAYGIFDN